VLSEGKQAKLAFRLFSQMQDPLIASYEWALLAVSSKPGLSKTILESFLASNLVEHPPSQQQKVFENAMLAYENNTELWKDAVKLFKQMMCRNVPVSEVTSRALLSACSGGHQGAWQFAFQHFVDCTTQKHGLKPPTAQVYHNVVLILLSSSQNEPEWQCVKCGNSNFGAALGTYIFHLISTPTHIFVFFTDSRDSCRKCQHKKPASAKKPASRGIGKVCCI